MEVLPKDQQKKLQLNLPKISQIAKTILHRQRIRRASVSLVFVTGRKIQMLNKKYLGRSYATDVLAFDLSEKKNKQLIGEVIISTDAAIKNAKVYGEPLAREVVLYVIHGLLHLSGYDDHRKKDIAKMRRREQKLLKELGKKYHSILNK